jgi:hypothetical protein
MGQATSGTVERAPGVARWLAISTGVIVLLALPAVFVMAIPRSGELGGVIIVPAVGLLVFELLVWWKPVVLSVTSRTVAPSVLFCPGAIASQVPWVVLSVTDLVLDSYLDIVVVLMIKAAAAFGTWVLQAPHRS